MVELNNELLNNSAIARKLGISVNVYNTKVRQRGFYTPTEEEEAKLKIIFFELFESNFKIKDLEYFEELVNEMRKHLFDY